MIDAGDPLGRQDLCQERPETTLHAVAHDGIADFLGDSDTMANGFGWCGVIISPSMRQQDEIGSSKSLAAIGGQKIRAFANHCYGWTGIGRSRIGRIMLFVQRIRQ